MDPGTILAVVTTSAAALSHIIQYYSDVKEARQDRERLHEEVKALHDVLQNVQCLANGPNASKVPSLSSYLKASCSPDIEELEARLNPGKGRKAMKKVGLRALKWPFDKKDVDKYIDRLERHKSTISAALGIDQTSLIVGIDQNVTQLQQGYDLAELDRLLAKLSYTGDAAFNSRHHQHEPRCLPNTRVDILHHLMTWSSSSEKCIFWLSGMAGTGKSTIARTIASSVADQGHLGASFFFSRGHGDLGHAGKFVSTLAYQLAMASSTLKRFICDAIAQQPDITHQSLSNQWRELIIQPLFRMDGNKSHLVLVIDALDECEREDDINLILQLLIKAKMLITVRLRVILTSRPEIAFRLGFQNMPEIIHQNLDLRDIPREIVQHDISEFLKHELGQIRTAFGLSTDWPDEKLIKALVEKSDCLFIYAATVCRFVGDRNWNPQKQLSLILENIPDSSPVANLDNMYLQILRYATHGDHDEKIRSELAKRFRQIVGPIIVSFNVVSISALESLLSVESFDMNLALNPLHSVLNISKNRESPIRLLHPSFRDFLLDRERCRDNHFWIDSKIVHMKFANDCLRLLFNFLKRNMCNLESSGHPINEISIDQVNHHLPKSVQYACCYWVAHLERVDPEHRNEIGLHDNGQIHSFFQKHFLHWFEALSLMRSVSAGVEMMARLRKLFNADEHPALGAMVDDARHLIKRNRKGIESAPLQLYVAVLLFSRKQCKIRTQYLDQFLTWIKCFSGVEDNSSSFKEEEDGHSRRVTALIFSSDGQLVASASMDGTIRIWNARTGALRHTLEGRSDWVTAVAFSSNDQLFASGSGCYTIQVWNTTTWTINHTLKSHAGRVDAVAFSPNGQFIASAAGEHIVRLWNTATGTLHRILEGHSGIVLALAFSNDQLVASASRDSTIRLWNVMSGTPLHTFEGHSASVSAVAFSPNSQVIASASLDQTIRFWNTETKDMIQQYDVEDIKTLFFSVDGSHIRTNRGQINLTANASPTQSQLGRTKPHWLHRRVHEELLFPTNLTGLSRSAVWGNIVVIGLGSGRVLFFGISSDLN